MPQASFSGYLASLYIALDALCCPDKLDHVLKWVLARILTFWPKPGDAIRPTVVKNGFMQTCNRRALSGEEHEPCSDEQVLLSMTTA